MQFKNPLILFSLFIVPALFYYILRKEKKRFIDSPIFSFFTPEKTLRTRMLPVSRILLCLALGFLLTALARPQSGIVEEKLITEGIDIVLTMDISSSMKAEDFKPNRLGAAKAVAREFISGRKTDRIGLVVFSRKAVTHSPLTVDYSTLYEFIDTIAIGMIQDGTAIGNAIAEGTKRLTGGEGKSRVLILLTDGVNNSGEIDPITAARAASAVGVKIYTIGVGSMGSAPFPVDDKVFGKRYVSVPVQIDEAILQNIASITEGRYFRATDTETLSRIYREIDTLEKSKIEIEQFKKTREWFILPLLLGAGLFCAYLLLSLTYLRIIP